MVSIKVFCALKGLGCYGVCAVGPKVSVCREVEEARNGTKVNQSAAARGG